LGVTWVRAAPLGGALRGEIAWAAPVLARYLRLARRTSTVAHRDGVVPAADSR
jgi:hypothetical protein